MILRQVKEFNQVYSRQGAEFIPFRVGTGGLDQELKQRGWVVSGYACKDSHKFFTNRIKALEFMSTIDL